MRRSKAVRVHVGVDATTWWNNRGFGRFTREIVCALAGRDAGFRYTLVVDRAPAGMSFPPGVDIVEQRARRSLTEAAVQAGARSPADMLRLGMRVARQPFDLFFFPAVYSFFPLLKPVPTVVTFHDTIAERYPRLVFPARRNELFWRAKVALARLQARRVMTVSRASARDLEEMLGIPAARIDVVTEGASPVFCRHSAQARSASDVLARHGLPAGVPLFVYVGGLSPHKNVLGLLRALPVILKHRPDSHLAIVCDISGKGFFDNQAELRSFVDSEAGLAERVYFTGYMSDEDLAALYNRASALVLPSLWEGFGLPAVEAMACGLPVLASARGSLPEVVDDAGLFFDPEAPGDIARAALELLAAPEREEERRERALARAGAFSWERGAELAEDCFRRALDRSEIA